MSPHILGQIFSETKLFLFSEIFTNIFYLIWYQPDQAAGHKPAFIEKQLCVFLLLIVFACDIPPRIHNYIHRFYRELPTNYTHLFMTTHKPHNPIMSHFNPAGSKNMVKQCSRVGWNDYHNSQYKETQTLFTNVLGFLYSIL